MSKRVVWITGGSSGIGLATANVLAERGYAVVISGRDEGKISAVVASLSECGHSVLGIPVDVTEPDNVQLAAATIVDKYGRLDALVANAGANVGARAWGEVSVEDFDRLQRLNVNGVFYCVNAVLPTMRQQGGGQVVVISSWAGVHVSGKPGPAYTSAKHAVVGLSETLNAAEYSNGIRACAICPGEVATDAMAKRKTPPSPLALSRMLKPEDVARTVGFVLDAPDHVTLNRIVISPSWNGAYGAPVN